MPCRSSSASSCSSIALPPSPTKEKNEKKNLPPFMVTGDLNDFCLNKVALSSTDFSESTSFVQVSTTGSWSGENRYVFAVDLNPYLSAGCIRIPMIQRKWTNLVENEEVFVKPYKFKASSKTQFLSSITMEVDFRDRSNDDDVSIQEFYDPNLLAANFVIQFCEMPLTVGQTLEYRYQRKRVLLLLVTSLKAIDPNAVGARQKPKKTSFGKIQFNSKVTFEKSENTAVNLILQKTIPPPLKKSDPVDSLNNPQPKNDTANEPEQLIIKSDWDFSKMGVGGVDKEFNAIFRRAFASRVFPPEVVEELGMNHVKGILLYGPPGTGKTLMASQIGKMLNARSLQIVNGPDLISHFVGDSEENVRKLFIDAETDARELGTKSGLHVIIFDEIDAICKKRTGQTNGNASVNDNMVNQLLTKIDGVNQLNNVLLIGMTNRKDIIDEALLRPGRFEIQMEIGLPTENGRLQILDIHTQRMQKHKRLHSDVDIKELAYKTKNFTGADIAGLVRAAQSIALNRFMKVESKIELETNTLSKLCINREDFLYALEKDVKAAFGQVPSALESYLNRGIHVWGSSVTHLLERGQLLIKQAQAGSGLVSVLIEGAPNAGKSAIAAKLALDSKYPFIKVCSADDMIGLSEREKCLEIRQIFKEAYLSEISCIVIDNVEGLIEYSPIGSRFSNTILLTLCSSLKKQPPKGRKLLILCTSSRKQVLENLEVLSTFTKILNVPNLSKTEHILSVLETSDLFRENVLENLSKQLDQRKISVGIRRLLDIIELTRQTEDEGRLGTFLTELEEAGAFESLQIGA